MRILLALTLLLVIPCGAGAQLASGKSSLPQTVRLHLVSWHDRGGYENANLGVALRWSNGLVAGVFNNSYSRASWYGGLVVPAFESRRLRLELMAGVITGYSQTGPLDVVAVPSLGWRLSPKSSLQLIFMPRFVIPANAVHLMFERRFGEPAPRPAP